MKEILAAYAVLPDLEPDEISGCLKCSNIDALLKQVSAKPPRRTGHMTRYACVGAQSCLNQVDGDKIERDRIGIFLGTALGNVTESILVQKQIFTEADQHPSPIKFSTSLSNMSAFHVAALTGISGPNMVISQNEASFEGAILSAQLFSESDDIDYALVGGVDCCFGTAQQLAQYYDFPEETLFGEGSGWILLGRDASLSLGEILDIRLMHRFPEKGETDAETRLVNYLVELISRNRDAQEPVRILPGLRIERSMIETLSNALSNVQPMAYLDQTGIYPTAAASGIADIISRTHDPGLYVHLALGSMNRFSAILFRLKNTQG